MTFQDFFFFSIEFTSIELERRRFDSELAIESIAYAAQREFDTSIVH